MNIEPENESLDGNTAKEILEIMQHQSDLRQKFEKLRPTPFLSTIQFIGIIIVFFVIAAQTTINIKDYPQIFLLILFPFLFLLGLIGTESMRIHKRIDMLAKILESYKIDHK